MKEIITEAQFRKQISTPESAYFFFGEEDYLKQNARTVARSTLIMPEAEGFDLIRIDQVDFSPEALASALEAPPMFGEYKLIDLSVMINELRASEMSALCDILGLLEGDPSNVLIINIPSGGIDPGTPKRPSSQIKKLSELARGVRFDRITPGRLAGWCGRHFAEHKVNASPEICATTVDYCGTDMFTLASEIDKISYYVLSSGRNTVTREDVFAAACATEEFDSFALANAILARDSKTALAVLGKMKGDRAEPVRIMAELIRVICDMNSVALCRRAGMNPNEISAATSIKPYPLGRYLNALTKIDSETLAGALDACREADAAVKGYGRGYVPIEKLICTL